ncbi:MAG: citrate transporter [Candidatus Lokiarchaeota archaeon]|nr:citrate transporter [Candidatus Harpocratesius repetitus]
MTSIDKKKIIFQFMKKEFIIISSLILLIILSLIYRIPMKYYPSFVDWHTILALAGLLVITTGLKESEIFEKIAKWIINSIKSEKMLALFMVMLTSLFSTLLTNDIALFIVIPLTISIQKLISNNISKILYFEVISVNVGSSLTPIGNPQNLYLWHIWDNSFFIFIFKLLPFVLILLLILGLFVWILFPKTHLVILSQNEKNTTDKNQNRALFGLSLSLLILYIILLEFDLLVICIIAIFACFILFFRRILLKVNWEILILFFLIFIDFHIISQISIITDLMQRINLNSSRNIFFLAVLISQLISNVPAAVFLSKYTSNMLPLIYGVNIGGIGFYLGSFANIIGLRLINEKKSFIKFHKYALPYFLISMTVIFLILIN